jgi:hypothetical protein
MNECTHEETIDVGDEEHEIMICTTCGKRGEN